MARAETLTIMFADMVDFTERTAHQSREENRELLETYNGLMLPLIRRFGGRRVKSMGDALLATFRSPTDGVRCGMALQDAVAGHNFGKLMAEQIHIRVALNSGEVRVERGDVLGEAVNLAARVEGVTGRGEITLTESTYLMMNRSEVAVKPVGEQKLKGIAEPVRLYRVPQRMGQRLMAVGADVAPAAEDVLPYGGMHLVECTDTRPAWVGTLRERLQDATVEADPRRLRLAALALLLVLSVALDVWYFTGSGDNETQPGAMTAAVPPPPDPQIARNRAASRIARQAHAQLAGGHPGEAAAAYARAIELNPLLAADARTAADLVGCLGFGTESATPLIRKYFNPVLRDELSRRTSQPGALGRQRAIELLTDVGQPRAIDRTGALLEDLKDAETCNARREVVKKLRAQRDPRALPALKATLQGGLGGWIANLCLRADAEAAVREIEQPRGARAKNRTAD